MNFVDQQIAKFKQRQIDERLAIIEAKKASKDENERIVLDMRNDYQKNRYKNNPEYRQKKLDTARRWAEKNKDRHREMQANWRDNNREKVNEYAKLWMRRKRAADKLKTNLPTGI